MRRRLQEDHAMLALFVQTRMEALDKIKELASRQMTPRYIEVTNSLINNYGQDFEVLIMLTNEGEVEISHTRTFLTKTN